MTERTPLLELKGVSKRYGGIAALTDVDFKAYSGEIHAVLGQNGAGNKHAQQCGGLSAKVECGFV